MSKVSDERLSEILHFCAADDDSWTVENAEMKALATELAALRSASIPAKAVKVTDAMIDLGVEYYSEGGCSGLDALERREVVSNILHAALSALEDAPQPEFVSQEPTPSATQGDLTIAREKQIEPVAWRCEDLILPGVSIIDDWEHAQARMSQPEAWKVTPLYALSHPSTPATGSEHE